MIKKFGLAEFERYVAEVGFKKSDVRTIRGVCVIVDLPITVVPEVEEVIVACNKDVIASERRIVRIETEDAQNEEVVRQGIARLKDEREATKSKNKHSVAITKLEAGTYKSEIARLQKLLKNFS